MFSTQTGLQIIGRTVTELCAVLLKLEQQHGSTEISSRVCQEKCGIIAVFQTFCTTARCHKWEAVGQRFKAQMLEGMPVAYSSIDLVAVEGISA